MKRFEVYASPQGTYAEIFPDLVVGVEEDRRSAARKAWNLQSKTRSDVCLYGIRREAPPEPSE